MFLSLSLQPPPPPSSFLPPAAGHDLVLGYVTEAVIDGATYSANDPIERDALRQSRLMLLAQ